MRSKNKAIKKLKADKRAKKRIEKINNRLEKKKHPKSDFNSMIAYVDKFGNITSEPPVESGPTSEEDPDSVRNMNPQAP